MDRCLRSTETFGDLMRLLPRKRKRPATFSAPLQPGNPFFVVGDVHGRSDLLERLVTQLDSLNSPAGNLVFVGDYIDRGDNSATVLNMLHRFQIGSPDDSLICLRGNHEQMLIDFLDAPEEHGQRWLRHGGLQTLASYRVGVPSEPQHPPEWRELRDHFRQALGAEIETWLRQLPCSWSTGNVFVCHAGADPALALDRQTDRTLLWGHADFLRTPRADGNWVVFGHLIHDQPKPEDGRIPVDTGAYATGKLTAAFIDNGHVAFIST